MLVYHYIHCTHQELFKEVVNVFTAALERTGQYRFMSLSYSWEIVLLKNIHSSRLRIACLLPSTIVNPCLVFLEHKLWRFLGCLPSIWQPYNAYSPRSGFQRKRNFRPLLRSRLIHILACLTIVVM
jgi:hypothetical protein